MVDKDFVPACEACGGNCCKYVAIEIDRPTTKQDYDNIRWYLLHKNFNVFIDHDNDWFIEVKTDCENLDKDNRCGIYDERPKICREHGVEEEACEYYGSPYKRYFRDEKEFIKYLDDKHIDWKFKNLK